MRKLISLMHMSLDGFCGGPNGELDWVALNQDIFADADDVIATAGAAVYSRVTHDMMRGYWPTLLDKPDSRPDSREVRHARWVEQIPKLTFSRHMRESDWNNVHLRRDARDILADKQSCGNNLLIFGSPGLTRAFLALDAVDEFWIFQNPILLGKGLAYFDGAMRTRLKLVSQRPFENGVVRLHYVKGE